MFNISVLGIGRSDGFQSARGTGMDFQVLSDGPILV